jgi:hypothetical protein
MVKSKSSLGPDNEHEYILVESNLSSFGSGGGTLEVAMWRLQKSLEEKSAAQERQTARKRRMDLTGSRDSTSNMMSSGSTTVRPGTVAVFLLLFLSDDASVVVCGMFAAPPQDAFLLLLRISHVPNWASNETVRGRWGIGSSNGDGHYLWRRWPRSGTTGGRR